MPNFAYTNQTNFRPFSYQEMLAPVLMATQAHQAIEEAYSELDSQANAIGSLANEANDPVTYQRYKAYESALRTQADALAKNGLTPGSRQSLLDLKGRYAKDITPIQNAITRRRELADEQRKALLQNPTLMFQRDMNSMSYDSSLDRFLENPDYDYGERYSGALLTQQVSQAASNLAKELTNYGNGKRLDAYTKTFLQQHGFTRDQVLDAISNPNRAQSQPVLNAIVEQVIGSSGMSNWADRPTMNKAYSYARQGLWSAIGQTNVSQYADFGARLAEQRATVREAEKNQYKINPLPLRSPQEISEKNKQIKDFIDKGYLKRTANGLTLTKAGQQQLRSANFKPIVQTWEQYKKANPGASRSSYDDMVARVERMGNRPNVFSTWYNRNIGGYNPRTGKVETPTTRLNRYENSIKADSYDTYHTTEYDRQLDSEYGKEYMTQMWSAAGTEDGEKVLYGVEFNGKKGWSKTKAYTKKDLEGYTVSNIRYFKNGDTAILQSTKEGKNDVIRIQIPRGINRGAETNVRSAITNADYWGSILSVGRQPVITADGEIATDANGNIIYSDIPLTEADKVVLKRKQDRALQDIYGYGSQTVVPSQTTNEQINPWY